jgi:hypothetical protein
MVELRTYIDARHHAGVSQDPRAGLFCQLGLGFELNHLLPNRNSYGTCSSCEGFLTFLFWSPSSFHRGANGIFFKGLLGWR